jgi:aspartate/tyrosine/aromatic aminotransferase
MVHARDNSIFSSCTLAPPDPILNLSVAYKKDTDQKKVDLGVGAYRDENGKPYVFKAVRNAEEAIMSDPVDNHEYTTIEGPVGLKPLCLKVMFGDELAVKNADRIVSAQSISGTGALRVAAEFLSTHCGKPMVYVSDPTWGNHNAIFNKAGLTVTTYPYWDEENKRVDIEGWLECLEAADPGSVILVHACAHNPTGCDPTDDDIKRVVEVIARRGLIAVADTAYQGYASGDLEKDSFMMRQLLTSGAEFFITQSFAKNMGLYGERFGMVHIITKSSDIAEKVMSQLKLVIRPMYSSPPIHGGKIALRILSNPNLYSMWLEELGQVSGRINKMRIALADGLNAAGNGRNWDHIKSQIGMFSYTGISSAQVERMTTKWHIYMLKNGRISLAGLNEKNIEYVIQAFDDCVRNA